jgi:hypothetical protein
VRCRNDQPKHKNHRRSSRLLRSYSALCKPGRQGQRRRNAPRQRERAVFQRDRGVDRSTAGPSVTGLWIREQTSGWSRNQGLRWSSDRTHRGSKRAAILVCSSVHPRRTVPAATNAFSVFFSLRPSEGICSRERIFSSWYEGFGSADMHPSELDNAIQEPKSGTAEQSFDPLGSDCRKKRR